VPVQKKKHVRLVQSSEKFASGAGYDDFRVSTRNGTVIMRLYEAKGATSGALMVGGVGGDFDSPAGGMYPRLATKLQEENVSGLRVQFRDPIDLDQSTDDVLAGLEFLAKSGITRVALVGHSFGGAVVIQAALRSPAVATVITLASQGFGTEGIEDISPRPIYLIHGFDDQVLPPACSIDAYNRAREPKTLKLIEGARHGLEEAADKVFAEVHEWSLERLRTPVGELS
jgi:pimeloyl-ACP methyl ester carboxylesterase